MIGVIDPLAVVFHPAVEVIVHQDVSQPVFPPVNVGRTSEVDIAVAKRLEGRPSWLTLRIGDKQTVAYPGFVGGIRKAIRIENRAQIGVDIGENLEAHIMQVVSEVARVGIVAGPPQRPTHNVALIHHVEGPDCAGRNFLLAKSTCIRENLVRPLIGADPHAEGPRRRQRRPSGQHRVIFKDLGRIADKEIQIDGGICQLHRKTILSCMAEIKSANRRRIHI